LNYSRDLNSGTAFAFFWTLLHAWIGELGTGMSQMALGAESLFWLFLETFLLLHLLSKLANKVISRLLANLGRRCPASWNSWEQQA